MKPEPPVDLSKPDYNDPILVELRQIRKEFWGRFNGDMKAMVRYIQEEERKLPPERFSSRVPRQAERMGAEDGRRSS